NPSILAARAFYVAAPFFRLLSIAQSHRLHKLRVISGISPIEEDELNMLILVEVEAQTVRLQQGDSTALRPFLAPPGRTASSRVIHARHEIVDKQPELAERIAVDGGRCQRSQRRLHAYFHARLIDHFAAAVPGSDP